MNKLACSDDVDVDGAVKAAVEEAEVFVRHVLNLRIQQTLPIRFDRCDREQRIRNVHETWRGDVGQEEYENEIGLCVNGAAQLDAKQPEIRLMGGGDPCASEPSAAGHSSTGVARWQ